MFFITNVKNIILVLVFKFWSLCFFLSAKFISGSLKKWLFITYLILGPFHFKNYIKLKLMYLFLCFFVFV